MISTDPTLQQNHSFHEEKSLASNSPNTPFFAQDDDEENDNAEKSAASFVPKIAINNQGEFNEDLDNDDDDEENLLSDFDGGTFNYDQMDDIDEGEDFNLDDMEDKSAPTFAVTSEDDEEQEPELRDLENILTGGDHLFNDMDDEYADYSSKLQPLNSNDNEPLPVTENQSYNNDNDNDNNEDQPLIAEGENDFFFAPDDLDDIPDIDAEELPVSSIFTKENKSTNNNNLLDNQDNVFDGDFDNDITNSFTFDAEKIDLEMDDDMSVSSRLSEPSAISSGLQVIPEVEIPQGKLAKYYDFSLFYKQLIHGGITAIVTFLAMVLVSVFSGTGKVSTEGNTETPSPTPTEQEVKTENSGTFLNILFLGLIGGITSGTATLILGWLLNNHIKRYINELKNQFDSIYQGDYDVKVIVYSKDEFGTLATAFNQMSKMINTTTREARKRTEETERAREDLQRQVIRLLDDVEGAARGDLTVQAEVTADVLGAVADAFNLTISSLRKIVKQVQQAAIQVNKASADSELYARNQSSDALRMAEELAVTLNSVQMMTDSIQRVAENAKEAEEVARSSSVTALKGGDAVERTVAGILQIRETVSETTRKVKRLAEASQQISTIVAVIHKFRPVLTY